MFAKETHYFDGAMGQVRRAAGMGKAVQKAGEGGGSAGSASHPPLAFLNVCLVQLTQKDNWSSEAYYAMYFPLRWLKALWSPWLVFDATPEYMVLPYCPRLIHRLTPDAKLVFMLREPAKRAYSGWQHQRKFHESSGDTSHSFEADLTVSP